MSEYKPKVNVRQSALLIVLAIVLMLAVAWLLTRENLYEMLSAVRKADRLLIVSAIAVYFVSVAVWASRWQATLQFIECRTSFATRYLILCAAIFFNNITPMVRVGGDPFGRVYLLHKLENTSYSSGMASSISEHVFTPLVIISFLMAGLLLEFGKTSLRLSLIVAVAWASVALGTVFLPRLFFRKRIAVRGISNIVNRVLGWFGRRKDVQEIMKVVEAFYASFYATIDKGKKAFLIGALTLLIGALDVFRLYIIFLAFGYRPELPMLLIASSLPVIVGLIPFLPGGLVLVEGSLISVFALFGVPIPLAMAATLIERGISFVLSTVVGAIVLSYLGIRMAASPVPINEDKTKGTCV